MKILEALPKLKYIDKHINLGSMVLMKLMELNEDKLSNKNVCLIVKNLGLIYAKLGDGDLLLQFLKHYIKQ